MDEFIMYLNRRIEDGRTEIEKLTAESRRDEANFARVRTNIYDVCKTVSRTLMNRPGAGVRAVRAQLERFHGEWSAALERAKEHGNIQAAAVEETKLTALEDIIAHFEEAAEA